MPGIFTYGGVTFGVREAKLAVWMGDGSYSTAVKIPSIKKADLKINTTNAKLEGDDRITATAAYPISGTLSIDFGSIDQRVLSTLIASAAMYEQGENPNKQYIFRIGAQAFRYVGLVVRALAAESAGGIIGDTQIFLPKLKVMEGFNATLEYGAFSVPTITMEALADEYFPDDNGDPGIVYFVENQTARAVEIPPYGIIATGP